MQGCQGRRNPLDIPFATRSNQTKFVEFPNLVGFCSARPLSARLR